jgi:hypothetical protein
MARKKPTEVRKDMARRQAGSTKRNKLQAQKKN